MTIIIMMFFVFSVFAILFTYRTRKTNKLSVWFIKLGLKVLVPSVIYVSGISKDNKDSIRKFYIDLNNILVEKAAEKRYSPEDILVILPHCLQNSKCIYKVTGAISNCKRCGRCCIGGIAGVCEELGVSAEIVTGGTAARNIVNIRKPEIILSVACERDLTSGISDIAGIPVLGIVNERPNGPCCNTNVDAGVIRERLKSFIGQSIKEGS